MAITLQQVITRTRYRHPAFHKRHVSDASLASFLSTYQRFLIQKGVQRNREFLTAQASVAVVISPANAVGVAAIGTGQLPVQAGVSPIEAAQSPMGAAVQIDSSSATELVARAVIDEVVDSQQLNVVVTAVDDQYNNKLVEIIAGPGVGQQRFVADTANLGGGLTALTFDEEWSVLPTTASVLRIVDLEASAAAASSTMGAVVAAPFKVTRTGYAVTIAADGSASIDYTTPLVVSLEVGCPLPAHHFILGGTVRTAQDDAAYPLTLIGYRNRFDADGEYVARIENGQLFLVGGRLEWEDAASIDLRYVPIAPDLTALTDELLLDDAADAVLVAACAHFAGQRVNGLEGVGKIDLADLRDAKLEAEGEWLRSLSQRKRNRRGVIRGRE